MRKLIRLIGYLFLLILLFAVGLLGLFAFNAFDLQGAFGISWLRLHEASYMMLHDLFRFHPALEAIWQNWMTPFFLLPIWQGITLLASGSALIAYLLLRVTSKRHRRKIRPV